MAGSGYVSAALRYWSAGPLAVAAVVLLLLGGPSKAAGVGAGFAFLGAAVTRSIDLAREHRTEAAQADASRRLDLDETRRVAYMALAPDKKTGRYVLAATIVNARLPIISRQLTQTRPCACHGDREWRRRGGVSEQWLGGGSSGLPPT